MRAAHSIKGASVNLGFTEVFEAAKGVEIDARENRLYALSGSVDSILEKLHRISECLQTKTFRVPCQGDAFGSITSDVRSVE